MSTLSSLPDRELSALQAAVQSLEARGRVTRIAGVKTEVLRHLPDFNEKALGYASFGAFVEAAADAGAVRVARDEDGWMRVSSPGSDTAGGGPRSACAQTSGAPLLSGGTTTFASGTARRLAR